MTDTPRALLADPMIPGAYYIFTDGALLHLKPHSEPEAVASIPNIALFSTGIGDGRNEGKELEVRLYAHGPWVGVTERFGLNAALVDTRTGEARPFARSDYHADVSSYSFGLLRHTDRTLVVAQTEWNRLDLFDAETGELLTAREVEYRDTGKLDADGHRVFTNINYIDYFHSLLQVNPSRTAFLSNGWVWHPAGMVCAYRADAFLTAFDPSGVTVDMPFGYDWDRPVAFIDDDTFVIAVDDNTENLDSDEIPDYQYHQLQFYTVPQLPTTERWRPPVRQVQCDAYPRGKYGAILGELHYDPTGGLLVALTTTAGTSLVTLNGEVVQHLPGLNAGPTPTDWTYSVEHRRFYRWFDGHVEEHPLPAAESDVS